MADGELCLSPLSPPDSPLDGNIQYAKITVGAAATISSSFGGATTAAETLNPRLKLDRRKDCAWGVTLAKPPLHPPASNKVKGFGPSKQLRKAY